MTGASTPSGTVVRSNGESVTRRRSVRYGTAVLCGLVSVLYLALFFLVRDAEAGLTENTFGAYLFLAVPYLVGVGLLLTSDVRLLWAVGATAQVVVLVLFVLFGAGLFGPGDGVFDYSALSGLPMGLFATVITTVQVIILGLLTYLALTPSSHRAELGPSGPGIGTTSRTA